MTSPSLSSRPTVREAGDNALYLRHWAADIRANNGKSVDADRLDSIAAELERLRKVADAAIKIVTSDETYGAATAAKWSEELFVALGCPKNPK